MHLPTIFQGISRTIQLLQEELQNHRESLEFTMKLRHFVAVAGMVYGGDSVHDGDAQ